MKIRFFNRDRDRDHRHNRVNFFFRYRSIKSLSMLNKNKKFFTNNDNFKIETFVTHKKKHSIIEMKNIVENNNINFEINSHNVVII